LDKSKRREEKEFVGPAAHNEPEKQLGEEGVTDTPLTTDLKAKEEDRGSKAQRVNSKKIET